MMKTKGLVPAIGAALVVAAALAAARSAHADAITKVKGTVVDVDGKPMQKVNVWLEGVDIKKKIGPLKTSKTGSFIIAALDISVAKKWRVYPEIPGYKVVKVHYEIIASDREERGKDDYIPGSKQEFPELQFALVGDDGRNVVDFVVCKEADLAAAIQAERKKQGGGSPAAAAAEATAQAAATPPPSAAGDESLRRAKQFTDAGRHAEAIELYRAFLAKDPTGNPAVYYYLGRSLFESRDDAGAETALRKGLELKPDMKGAHFFLGNMFLRQAEDPVDEQVAAARAVAEYEAELALTPDSDSVTYNLGMAYGKTGQDDKALAAFEKALLINPARSEAYLKMASIYEKRKDSVRAQEMYEKFSAADPTNAAVSLYNIGVIAWNENRARDAVQYYRKAVEIDPKYAVAHRELARALMGSQDFTGALKHFQEYLRLNPKAADAKEIQESIALLK